MNQFDQQWRKLTTLARSPADTSDVNAPYGFATRVAARAAMMPAAPSWAPFEHFAVRGLMVAAAFGLAAIAFNYSTLVTSTMTDAYAAADTVNELMDLS